MNSATLLDILRYAAGIAIGAAVVAVWLWETVGRHEAQREADRAEDAEHRRRRRERRR